MTNTVDEFVLSASLDDIWRTAQSVKRLVGRNGWEAHRILDALRRLALAGKIEKREHNTTVPKLNHKRGTFRQIEFYRRNQ